MAHGSSHGRGLWLIAAFKILKGVALLFLGIGALRLLHKDVAAEVEAWINYLRVDPDNHYVQQALAKIGLLNDRKLKEFSFSTFFYSGLLLTEGIGLSLRQRWAEYFTIITTASLLPLEMYEIAKRASWPRIGLLLVNIAVVVYLVMDVRRKREQEGTAK
jgi:uncharacterized membrane protein (DUF2068 family)